MNLIIETDVGHDVDDFFSICYLAASGVDIRAIVITPGDRDQLATANFLRKELNLDIPIGYSKESEKYSAGGVHTELLKNYGYSKDGCRGDGFGKDIIKQTLEKYPDSELFIIGPPSNTGRFLEQYDATISRATMQGGFLGYHLHPPQHRLEKFEGKTWVPTFNMNGDRKGTDALLKARIGERRFCGKNVCHTVLFTKDRLAPYPEVGSRAAQLFWEAGNILLRNRTEKKFHDPVAAVCHLHPEVGTWVRGRPQRMEGGWGTIPDPQGDYVLADLDHDQFWNHIRSIP